MARFPRPYCATEPVRTVPFFNLYDDIQITQLGAFTDEFGTTTIAAHQPAPVTDLHGAHALVVWPWGAYLGAEGLEQGIRAKVSSYSLPG